MPLQERRGGGEEGRGEDKEGRRGEGRGREGRREEREQRASSNGQNTTLSHPPADLTERNTDRLQLRFNEVTNNLHNKR